MWFHFLITTKFCTCHDSYAVVVCAKFCSDHFLKIWVRVREKFLQNLNFDGKIDSEKSPLVPRHPRGCLTWIILFKQFWCVKERRPTPLLVSAKGTYSFSFSQINQLYKLHQFIDIYHAGFRIHWKQLQSCLIFHLIYYVNRNFDDVLRSYKVTSSGQDGWL